MARPVLNWRSCASAAPARKLVSRPPTTLLKAPPPRALSAATLIRAPHARFFHHTPVRRVIEAPDALITVAGLAAGWYICWRSGLSFPPRARVINVSSVPPLSWAFEADPQTKSGVLSAIGAGFSLARSRPASLQNDALREVTFKLPYEIARLNKDAPQFKLEDMGAIPDFSNELLKVLDVALDGYKPPFDHQKDTRVFLYFPNDEEKATAAFLVMNTEFTVPDPQKHHEIKMPPSTHENSGHLQARAVPADQSNHALIRYAIHSWLITYGQWQQNTPEVINDNIKPGELPIIFCFRDKTCGSGYDQENSIFRNPQTTSMVLGLVDPA